MDIFKIINFAHKVIDLEADWAACPCKGVCDECRPRHTALRQACDDFCKAARETMEQEQ